jgi:hypothetical protein
MLSVEIKENDKVVGMLTAEQNSLRLVQEFFGISQIQIGEKSIRCSCRWWRLVRNRNLRRRP